MVDVTNLLAVGVSFGAAIVAASQSLFVRMGTDEGRAFDAVIVVMLFNLAVLVPVVGVLYYPHYRLTVVSVLSFVGAGIGGTLLGRVFLYTSIGEIGASRTAPIVASRALISTLLGIAFLGESLLPIHGLGIVLVVAGIAVIAWETGQESRAGSSRRESLTSLAVPLGAALAYGWEPIFANFGFAEGTPAPVGLTLKTVAATAGFTLYLRWRGSLPTLSDIDARSLRWYLLAGVANTVFLLSYYTALEMAPVNIVVPILITQTLFVVLLSAVFMPRRLERVTYRLVAAAAVVVVGAAVITVYG